jgi:hypothetical protein
VVVSVVVVSREAWFGGGLVWRWAGCVTAVGWWLELGGAGAGGLLVTSQIVQLTTHSENTERFFLSVRCFLNTMHGQRL